MAGAQRLLLLLSEAAGDVGDAYSVVQAALLAGGLDDDLTGQLAAARDELHQALDRIEYVAVNVEADG